MLPPAAEPSRPCIRAYMSAIYGLYVCHIWLKWQSYMAHVSAIYGLNGSHIWLIYQPYMAHVSAIYGLYGNALKTLIKLPDRSKVTHNCRVMGSVWVLFFLSAHTRPIYPTHFAGNPYPARITATITPN